MSQVKLTLRPPPNVDFVQGYPGIPTVPGERPEAAVKGALEVRVGPQGSKAKWVRVELRKVETLPGGGQANTFFDFVGPSPVNLWTPTPEHEDEYAPLMTQDFPFSIRIPESIPPSIALENRAGIKYELVASVCTKGKKGFLRRRKPIVISAMAPIIIDKHELHSTWPVYCQPETRHLAQDGVNLTVERNHTCYGPGDRVSVIATLKSDSLHTVILRGFELTLKESTIFRVGPYGNNKKSAPQVRVKVIGESKLAINATLYGGTQHRAELTCDISPKHTTTTLNAARHIDITYLLSVKALMGTGTHLIMDLPVIISNWQRAVSTEAVRRIGQAPGLSLLHPHPGQAGSSRESPTPAIASKTDLTGSPSPGFSGRSTRIEAVGRTSSANAFNSLPNQINGYPKASLDIDEFGYGRSSSKVVAATMDPVGYGSRPSTGHQHSSSRSANQPIPTIIPPAPAARTTRTGSNAAVNRFTITNAVPSDTSSIAESSHKRKPSASATSSPSGGSPSRGVWLTAEQEKERLYQKAKERVEKVQGSAGRGDMEIIRTTTPPLAGSQMATGSGPQPSGASPRNTPWPTAEEEKLRLFNQAQAAARKTQQLGGSYTSSLNGRSNSIGSMSSDRAVPSTSVSGAALYSQAMSSRSTESSPRTKAQVKPPVPQYLTAEQEKAALRRYNEAKLAVDRTQGMGYGDEPMQSSGGSSSSPIAYDALYPAPSTSVYPSGGSDSPPAFDSPSTPSSHLSEKERLRRAYEARDAADLRENDSGPPPMFPTGGSSSSSGFALQQGLSEKEMLRRKFEAQDAESMAAGGSSIPQPPPRTNRSASATARPIPTTPAPSGSSRILTAAEEKALLRAKYASDDGITSHPSASSSSLSSLPTPPAPPPLMPRPPVEYIQETQEEDARVSRFVSEDGHLPLLDPVDKIKTGSGLDIRPFTPFASGFENGTIKLPGPPPPLPPKPSNSL